MIDILYIILKFVNLEYLFIDKIIPRRFLQWAKWDIDKAKLRVNSFYKYRIKNLEWFQHRDITKNPLKDLIDIGVFLPLKELNKVCN